MTKIEEARNYVETLSESLRNKFTFEIMSNLYESAYKELEFDRDQCKLLLVKMMEYVKAEEAKDKKRILRV